MLEKTEIHTIDRTVCQRGLGQGLTVTYEPSHLFEEVDVNARW
jgi:hypothetical protein